jgi:NAD(P)-dependent dehydrogenase (short-subunit alcohol dehydrogenase family)
LEKVFDLIRDGTFKIVSPVTLYDYSEFEQVFRLMNDGKNIGKIVFKITPESIVNATPQKRSSFSLNPNSTYVLVGGLGGLGRGMAMYLAEHGAKHIAFISRSGAIMPESREVLEALHSKNINAIAYSCDVADTDKLKLTIDQINQDMPVIKGVIQAAMVLKDSIFENMEYESWVAATRPKIQGTWNLHELMLKDLEFFIMLSSATAIIGNRGQANYCAGNTFQDALAYYRKALGLPAVSIDLGAIRGIGWVAENKDSEILKAMDRIIVDQEHFYSVLNSAITGYSYGEHKIPTQLVTAAGTGVSGLLSLLKTMTNISRPRVLLFSKAVAHMTSGGWTKSNLLTFDKSICTAKQKRQKALKET